jgi:hypothetical protein
MENSVRVTNIKLYIVAALVWCTGLAFSSLATPASPGQPSPSTRGPASPFENISGNVIRITSPVTTGNFTVPAHVTLKIEQGGTITVSSGKTLTINGPFQAGLYQVFAGSGTVEFGKGSVAEVLPEWWSNNTVPGSTDMGPALNSAAKSISSHGGVIKLQCTTYLGSTSPNPENKTYRSVMFLGSNTTLRGCGLGSSVITLSANSPAHAAIIQNINIGSGNRNITVEDVGLDGNAANQSAERHLGAGFLRVRGLYLSRVEIKNVRGTAGSGPGEGFHFDAGLCSDVFYTNCSVVGDSGSTSSGFSANSSTNVSYVNCIARGMTTAGFTHNGCSHVTYTNCRSYLNKQSEFNSEASRFVTYTNCQAGGHATTAGAAYPFKPGQNLGGARYGFVVVESRHVNFVGCSATYEQTGLYLSPSAGSISVNGFDASFNSLGFNIAADTARTSKLVDVRADSCSLSPLSIQPSPGYSPLYNAYLPAPALVHNTDIVNPFPFPVSVIIHGGTVNEVIVEGKTVGAARNLILHPGWGVKVRYSGLSVWLWVAA